MPILECCNFWHLAYLCLQHCSLSKCPGLYSCFCHTFASTEKWCCAILIQINLDMPPKIINKSDLSNDPCPGCKVQFLTKPKVSSGYHNPDNANCMYQQACFYQTKSYMLANGLSSVPEQHTQWCYKCDGFYWRDDLEASTKTTSEHCTGPICSARENCAALHQRCCCWYCLQCCSSTEATTPGRNCPAPCHSTSSTNEVLIPMAQSYERMWSPIYHHKLQDMAPTDTVSHINQCD